VLPVNNLVDGSLHLWRAANVDLPELGRRYNPREQQERERIADACLDRVHEAIQGLRRRKLQPQTAQERIKSESLH
jgi:hypothetical protein